MQLLFGHDHAVWQWANRFFESPLPQPTFAVGIIDGNGVLRGAVLCEERTETTIEMTVCGERAITPKVTREFFRIVCGRYWRIQVRTTRNNKTAKRNIPKWGFTFEGVERDYFGPGRSALTFAMLAPECRWLKREKTHGLETKRTRTDQRGQRRKKAVQVQQRRGAGHGCTQSP